MRREYKQRSERLSLTTAVEKVIPTRDIPRGQSPMELLTPRKLGQTTEVRPPDTTGRVTIPDPSDTLGDPVREETVRKLVETAERLVANRNAPGSGVTAPYGTIDDTGRVQFSQETMARTAVSDATLPTKSSKVPDRKIREMPFLHPTSIYVRYAIDGDVDGYFFFRGVGVGLAHIKIFFIKKVRPCKTSTER